MDWAERDADIIVTSTASAAAIDSCQIEECRRNKIGTTGGAAPSARGSVVAATFIPDLVGRSIGHALVVC